MTESDSSANDALSLAKSWLSGQTARVRRPLAASVVISLLDGLLLIAQSWLLARIMAAVVIDGHGLNGVWLGLWAVLAVLGARAVLSPLMDVTAFEAAARVKHAARLRLYRHLQNLGPVWANGQRSGDIAHTLTDAVESLDSYYAGYLPQMARTVFLPLAILAFILPSDWVSGLVLMLTAPLIPVFMIFIGRGTERLNQRQWRRLALMSAYFLDAIEGLTTLKLFGASRREADMVARMSEGYRQHTMRVLRLAFVSSLVLEFLATVSIAMVAVFIGFRLYYGQMDFLPGLFVLILAPEFYQPLRNMGTQYHARMEAIGAAERIVELFASEPPVAADSTGGQAAPARVQQIVFEQVGFGYEEHTRVISQLDLSLQRGQRLALVGPSGAGKTTISRLLLGFLSPDAGRIRINDMVLEALDSQDWLSHIAWLGQNPTLFHGSIADNIRLGAPEADEAAVRRAARLANADDFITALPAGYDTRVGDRGQGLSGGEIQRIALARAFARQADVVILDEASASLDPDTEALITEAVERLAQDRLMLVIAHRLDTVRRADAIAVLDQGRIVEQGSHEQLLAAGGRYAAMLSLYTGRGEGWT